MAAKLLTVSINLSCHLNSADVHLKFDSACVYEFIERFQLFLERGWEENNN